jgi:hypothetical protein
VKLVKLNRRYKAFKEYGHRWAFRWQSYSPKECGRVEKIMQDMHGSQWRWNRNDAREWQATFGHISSRQATRPYWISFKNEQDATVVLLKMSTDEATS